jgi:hypothetical protein
MAFFRDHGAVESFEFGVVRFQFWVFPCSRFGEAVFSAVHAKHRMLIEK